MVRQDNEITTLSSIAHMVAQTLENHDIDSQSVFNNCGIDLTTINTPEARVPAINMQKVWHTAVKLTGNHCFGIEVAKNIQPGALHGLGFSWIASNTLKDALDRLVRYFRVLVSEGEVILKEDNEHLIL